MDWIEEIVESEDRLRNFVFCDDCGDSPHVEIDGRLRCCVCGADHGPACDCDMNDGHDDDCHLA